MSSRTTCGCVRAELLGVLADDDPFRGLDPPSNADSSVVLPEPVPPVTRNAARAATRPGAGRRSRPAGRRGHRGRPGSARAAAEHPQGQARAAARIPAAGPRAGGCRRGDRRPPTAPRRRADVRPGRGAPGEPAAGVVVGEPQVRSGSRPPPRSIHTCPGPLTRTSVTPGSGAAAPAGRRRTRAAIARGPRGHVVVPEQAARLLADERRDPRLRGDSAGIAAPCGHGRGRAARSRQAGTAGLAVSTAAHRREDPPGDPAERGARGHVRWVAPAPPRSRHCGRAGRGAAHTGRPTTAATSSRLRPPGTRPATSRAADHGEPGASRAVRAADAARNRPGTTRTARSAVGPAPRAHRRPPARAGRRRRASRPTARPGHRERLAARAPARGRPSRTPATRHAADVGQAAISASPATRPRRPARSGQRRPSARPRRAPGRGRRPRDRRRPAARPGRGGQRQGSRRGCWRRLPAAAAHRHQPARRGRGRAARRGPRGSQPVVGEHRDALGAELDGRRPFGRRELADRHDDAPPDAGAGDGGRPRAGRLPRAPVARPGARARSAGPPVASSGSAPAAASNRSRRSSSSVSSALTTSGRARRAARRGTGAGARSGRADSAVAGDELWITRSGVDGARPAHRPVHLQSCRDPRSGVLRPGQDGHRQVQRAGLRPAVLPRWADQSPRRPEAPPTRSSSSPSPAPTPSRWSGCGHSSPRWSRGGTSPPCTRSSARRCTRSSSRSSTPRRRT